MMKVAQERIIQRWSVYHPAIGIEAALDEIAKETGRLYDPTVVDAA